MSLPKKNRRIGLLIIAVVILLAGSAFVYKDKKSRIVDSAGVVAKCKEVQSNAQNAIKNKDYTQAVKTLNNTVCIEKYDKQATKTAGSVEYMSTLSEATLRSGDKELSKAQAEKAIAIIPDLPIEESSKISNQDQLISRLHIIKDYGYIVGEGQLNE